MKKLTLINTLCLLAVTPIYAQISEPATISTQNVNTHFTEKLNFKSKQDFENATRGLIAKPDRLKIRNAEGLVIWDMTPFEKTQKVGSKSPAEVNPSLWRQATLNAMAGLYKVTDNIYQIRGYDLSVMTIIEGKTGYIVVDPLTSKETAKAAIELFFKHMPKKPIVAVIYTHTHLDHFGGVKGVINEKDVKAGKIKVIAPKDFMEHAISENVYAGNAMSRRATYMYGSLLPNNAYEAVDVGLGKKVSSGTPTLIPPTDIIDHTGQTMTIDGVKFEFQYTPDTEAPTEMNFYLPQYKALCMAENATHTLHNLYTLRGAKVRDAKNWSDYLNETIQLYGKDAQVEFASHHWPTWGNKNIVEFLKKQRDIYKYLHDQTLRLANEGYTMNEIAEKITLPESLSKEWYNRDYYGTVNHNVKAIYQRYLGWFDGNPANLHPLPPVEESKKYVEYMGGEKAVIQKAKKDYDEGNYRWVAKALNHVVFANPKNNEAKELLGDTYEQLAYQSESGPWRNFYLTGAQELRRGVVKFDIHSSDSPDILRAMTMPMILDFMAIKVNGPKAAGKDIALNFVLPDTNEKYALHLQDAVLNYQTNQTDPHADATITIDRETIDELALGQTTSKEAIKAGKIKLTGDKQKINEFFELLDKFNFWFNIVTP